VRRRRRRRPLPDRVSGIDAITQDAITFKVLPAPLTREQIADLIQIPPRDR